MEGPATSDDTPDGKIGACSHGMKNSEFCFLKWRIVVYFIFFSDGEAPQTISPLPLLSSDLNLTRVAL